MNKREQEAVDEAARKEASCEHGFSCGRCPEHERQYECEKFSKKESFVEGAQFLDSLRKPSGPHEIIAGNRQYVRKDLALEFAIRFYQIMIGARVDEYVGARKDVCVNDLFEEFIKSKSDERP